MPRLWSVLALAIGLVAHYIEAKCACSAGSRSVAWPMSTPGASGKYYTTIGTATNQITPLPAPAQIAPALTDDDLPDPEAEEQELRARLGRATWYLLHTMAAKYPDSPTVQEKQRMLDFIRVLGEVYPCPICSEHFRGHLAKSPPNVESRATFSQWMCNMHNTVNRMLGKAEFPCANVNSFYDCGCEVLKFNAGLSQSKEVPNPSVTNESKAMHAIVP